MDNAYSQAPEHVLQHFQVDEHKGLEDAQVLANRATFGSNGELPNLRTMM